MIAIIGTLASVVLASLNSAREKARDSNRVSTLREVQKALELYALDHNGSYPTTGGTNDSCGVSTCLTDAEELVNGGYLPSIPLDPTAGNTTDGYRYGSDSGNDYTLLVRLETDSHTSWCGISGNGGFDIWAGASWYREITSEDCDF